MYKVFKEQSRQKETIIFESKKFEDKYKESSILLTGAAGSIGKEIAILLKNLNVKRIVLFDQSELGVFDLKNEFSIDSNKEIFFVLGSIRDFEKVNYIIKKYSINTVIHAAAYKHVTLIEEDFYEAIRTNIEGTVNLYNASRINSVKEFLFISTDKAVNPKCKMGVSKKIAEIYINSFKEDKLNVKVVRFGNVINSNGSVIPLFEKQIKENNYITLTSTQATRYFIFSAVVAKSILNTLTFNYNGNFLLKMGNPILIYDLAKEFVTKDINKEIKITNLNKGEKLHELLLGSHESLEQTIFPNVYQVINNNNLKIGNIKKILELLDYNKNFKKKKIKQNIEYILQKNNL